jgi:hypothetical protein
VRKVPTAPADHAVRRRAAKALNRDEDRDIFAEQPLDESRDAEFSDE